MNIITIIELLALAVLIGINIWMLMEKKARSRRSYIESSQIKEQELNELLINEAGEKEKSGKLRPFEEKYSSESREPVTADWGIKIELKVITPGSEKKYLTTVTDRLRIGSDSSNELILDSLQVAGREADLVREKKNLYFRRLNPRGEVYVVRSRSRKTLTEAPLRIHSQDQFYMQDVMLEIRFV